MKNLLKKFMKKKNVGENFIPSFTTTFPEHIPTFNHWTIYIQRESERIYKYR